MKALKRLIRAAMPAVILFCGCSGADIPVQPQSILQSGSVTESVGNPGNSANLINSDSQRMLWGVWDFGIDLETLSVTVSPSRYGENHFNVLPFLSPPKCSGCLKLHVNSFDEVTGILDLDVTLRNKFAIAGYDVRGILFTDDLGHLLKNPDNWIELYDVPGGGAINPFIAYAKDDPLRKFPGEGELTENYLISAPDPPKFFTIKYAVDASYPSNCAEPYAIVNFAVGNITANPGSHATVSVDIKDWQNDVDVVRLDSQLSDNPVVLTHQTGDTWTGELANANGVGEGGYVAQVVATSSDSGSLALFGLFSIQVNPVTGDGWAKTWGGSHEDWGYCVAGDGSGNVYVTGWFWSPSGPVDFDPDPFIVDLHSSFGASDIFLSKFDSTGALMWARTWGGTSHDDGFGVIVDETGNVYVTGTFESASVDFDPGTGEDLHSTTGDSYDSFISKFDSSGTFVWARTWGGNSGDFCMDVAVDGSGDVYATGSFAGWFVDFDPGATEDLHSTNGGDDIFLSKFDSSGTFAWARTWGGPTIDWGDDGNGVAADDSGNVYVTGSFMDSVDFNPDTPEDIHTSNGWYDIFLSKFDTLGTFVWARTWGGSDFDFGNDVALNAGGNPYVTGEFASTTADFDPGAGNAIVSSNGDYDVFINKIDTLGTFTSVVTWGGPQYDTGVRMNFDDSGNLFVTGVFSDTVDFDPGTGVDEHSAFGTSSDIYLCKFDTYGAFKWARTWGGSDNDRAKGVAGDGEGNSYVTGEFLGNGVDFDPGTGVDLHSSNGDFDIFLSKFNPDGNW